MKKTHKINYYLCTFIKRYTYKSIQEIYKFRSMTNIQTQYAISERPALKIHTMYHALDCLLITKRTLTPIFFHITATILLVFFYQHQLLNCSGYAHPSTFNCQHLLLAGTSGLIFFIKQCFVSITFAQLIQCYKQIVQRWNVFLQYIHIQWVGLS